MERLKPSEVRLLILFSAVIVGLGSYFLYEVVAEKHQKLKQTEAILETQKQSYTSMMSLRTDFAKRRDYLDSNLPSIVSELRAEEDLDTFVSVPMIQSFGLERLESRSGTPEIRDHYRVFSRTVIVQGGIKGIIEWLASLQSETQFRAITQFRIWPPDKREPEILRCQITLEQRYSLDPAYAPAEGLNRGGMEAKPSVPDVVPPGLPGGEASLPKKSEPGLVLHDETLNLEKNTNES